MRKRTVLVLGCSVLLAAAATVSVAQDVGTPDERALRAAAKKRPYSPYAGGAVPNRVFWG